MNRNVLTIAQKQALSQGMAHNLFLIEFHGRNGLHKASWEKIMKNLMNFDLVKPYPHGGYEITELGKSVYAENRK